MYVEREHNSIPTLVHSFQVNRLPPAPSRVAVIGFFNVRFTVAVSKHLFTEQKRSQNSKHQHKVLEGGSSIRFWFLIFCAKTQHPHVFQ